MRRTRARRLWPLIVAASGALVLMVVGGILALGGDAAPRGRGLIDGEAAVRGQLAPDFELEDAATGRLLRLSEFRGRPVVLNFSATWCITCVAEFASFEQAQEELGAAAAILVVNFQQPKATVVGLLERMQLDAFPVLLDGDGSVTRHYRVIGLPTTVLIDAEGRLVRTTQAFMSAEAISTLLAEVGVAYRPPQQGGGR